MVSKWKPKANDTHLYGCSWWHGLIYAILLNMRILIHNEYTYPHIITKGEQHLIKRQSYSKKSELINVLVSLSVKERSFIHKVILKWMNLCFFVISIFYYILLILKCKLLISHVVVIIKMIKA